MPAKLTAAQKRQQEREAFASARAAWVAATTTPRPAEQVHDMILDQESACRRLAAKEGRGELTVQDRADCAAAKQWLIDWKPQMRAAHLHVAVRRDVPDRLATMCANYREQIAKWAKDLETNPLSALSWSNGTFEVAAKLEVAARLLNFVTSDRAKEMSDEDVAKTMNDWAHQEVLRRARTVENSTSRTANLAEDYLRSAWVRVLETTEVLVEHGQWMSFQF